MSAPCYANTSFLLPDYGACDFPQQNPTWCCTPGQICLTNGLCATDLNAFYVGGCTDETYKDKACPRFCQSDSKQFVVQCPKGSAVGEGLFCCSADGKQECCDSKQNGLGIAMSESLARAATATTAAGSAQSSNIPPSASTTSRSQSGSNAESHMMPLLAPTTASSSASSAYPTNAAGKPVRPVGRKLPVILVTLVSVGALLGALWVCWKCWKSRRRQQITNVVTAPPQTLSSTAPNTPVTNNHSAGTEIYGIELNELPATAETAPQAPELPNNPLSTTGQASELPAGPSRYREVSTDGVNDRRDSFDFLDPLTANGFLESGPSNAQNVPDVQGEIDETPLRQGSAPATGSDSTSDSFIHYPEYDIMTPPSYEAATSGGQTAAASSTSEQGERVTGTQGMLNAPAGTRRRRSTNARQTESP